MKWSRNSTQVILFYILKTSTLLRDFRLTFWGFGIAALLLPNRGLLCSVLAKNLKQLACVSVVWNKIQSSWNWVSDSSGSGERVCRGGHTCLPSCGASPIRKDSFSHCYLNTKVSANALLT